MKRTQLHLAIVLTGMGVLGAFWAVHAQELFLPPPVLQADTPLAKEPEKQAQAPAKYPGKTLPLPEKPKADPTLIIPPAAFELPRPVRREAGKGELRQTGGVIPPPAFPPPPVQVKESLPIPLPSPPSGEPRAIMLPVKPPAPLPLPEPTKLLIEPATKMPGMADKAVVFPPSPAVQAAPQEKPKAFIRMRPAASEVVPPPVALPSDPLPPIEKPFTQQVGVTLGPLPPPPGVLTPTPGALVNVQIPAISIEKRGPATLRAGVAQSYDIIIRNVGAVTAQQIRVEDVIPPGAKIVSADPQPLMQGGKAIWTLAAITPGSAHTAHITLQADVPMQLGNALTVLVGAAPTTVTTVQRPPLPTHPLSVRLTGPAQASVGKPVAFEIHVANLSGLPLTGIKLFGYLPEGLNTPDDREIEGAVEGAIAPGSSKILKMPANAVKSGRYSVRVKVVTSAGEASATTTLDIAAAALTVQQAPTTRLFVGREGSLRFEITNGTGKTLHNVAVACQLPEGLDFLAASERGLFQSPQRVVYWMIDAMPVGETRLLAVRVVGAKAGELQNPISVRADGVAEVRSTGAIVLEGAANLKMRVLERDNPLEIGKETVYEIQIANSGGAPAHNVKLQVQFPAGLALRNAEASMHHSVEKQTVTFEPIALVPDGQATYRVWAQAQTAGDQRVRFSVVSDEVPTAFQREISTKVY